MWYALSVYTRERKNIIRYARFGDESAQRYAHSRSTGILVECKRERRRDAEELEKL
jgi:hypothetical protein